MQPKTMVLPRGFQVREKVRPGRETDSSRLERDTLVRQYRRERVKRETAWNDGFRAAIAMVAHGATLERLQAALGEGPLCADEISDGVPVFAHGTMDFEKEDTEPCTIVFTTPSNLEDKIITDPDEQ